MKINGIDGLTVRDLQDQVTEGGKFVIFSYCFSIVVMTFKRGTSIYYIKPGESAFLKSLPWTLLSLVVGWWGFPWGIIYTPMAIISNLGGGKDVTEEVMGFIHQQTNGPVFDFEKEVTAEEEKQLDQLKDSLEK